MLRPPILRPLLLITIAVGLTGCQWLRPAPAQANAELARENADLRLERKLLQEELALVRREQDALRRVAEASTRPGASERTRQLAAELERARAELAELRARPTAPASADARANEDRVAAILRDVGQLQAENTRLREEIAQVRGQNAMLERRAREAEAALGTLNVELVAQREAAAAAQRQSAGLRSQLDAVLASAGTDAAVRTAAADRATTLGTATLTATRQPDGSVQTSARAGSERVHRVKAGETLASIAFDYYGTVERWRDVYVANSAKLGDNQPLSPGTELVIP